MESKLGLNFDLVEKARTSAANVAADVQGFIENHAQNFKLSGLWKVYGDEAYARAAFAKYKKCTDIYCRSWRSGASLEALTVAG